MYCGHCGKPTQTNDRHCGHCGEKIEQNAVQQSASPAAESTYAVAPALQAQPGVPGFQQPALGLPGTSAATAASSPVLQTWKTSDNFAIFGFALGFFLVDPGPRLAIKLGYSPYDTFWPAWAYAVHSFFVVVYYLLPLLYAAIAYPSYFGDRPLFRSNKLISFLNVFCGGFFGLFWNHNLTRKDKGISHRVALVFYSLRIVLALVMTVFVSLYTGGPTGGAFELDGAEPSSSAEWGSYIYHDQGFTVDFPGTPRVEHDEIEPNEACIAHTKYTHITGSSVYALAVTEFPDGYYDVESEVRYILDGCIDRITQDGDCAIDERDNTGLFLGNPSASAVLHSTDGPPQITLQYFVFMKDDAIYAFITSEVNEEDFDRFVHSFRFEE